MFQNARGLLKDLYTYIYRSKGILMGKEDDNGPDLLKLIMMRLNNRGIFLHLELSNCDISSKLNNILCVITACYRVRPTCELETCTCTNIAQ